jgi:hypothetical protein
VADEVDAEQAFIGASQKCPQPCHLAWRA